MKRLELVPADVEKEFTGKEFILVIPGISLCLLACEVLREEILCMIGNSEK